MENEFIPYEQALALKELGFDEPCAMYWRPEMDGSMHLFYHSDPCFGDAIGSNNSDNAEWVTCTAPTFSQAFRWFREVYKINPQIAFCEYSIESENSWKFTFDNPTKRQFWQGEFDNYEEAELACLKKLIEVVKQ